MFAGTLGEQAGKHKKHQKNYNSLLGMAESNTRATQPDL